MIAAGAPAWAFYLAAACALVSAFALLLARSASRSVLVGLVGVMTSLAVIFVGLEAHLVAALQLLIGVGAIGGVLFAARAGFAVPAESPSRQIGPKVTAACVCGLGAWILIRWNLSAASVSSGGDRDLPPGFGTLRAAGERLYTDFALPLEVATLLLLAAIVSAVVLAKEDAE
ncbi:MAG: hypothetical protein GWO02_21220 [Gammaproteobacteria bacterium]|nr:hypothetical protein [Gammaproteobacteria bacterium]